MPDSWEKRQTSILCLSWTVGFHQHHVCWRLQIVQGRCHAVCVQNWHAETCKTEVTLKWLECDSCKISWVLQPQSTSFWHVVMSLRKSQSSRVCKLARKPKCMMVEVKKMRQLVRAVQSLTSQSKVGTSPPQASSAGNQRTSRGCKHCLNPVVGKQGCYEARARRALKLLEHMGSRVGDLSQPKRSTHPPPATSMDFVPGSQQSIESMHPVTHVWTAYRIGDHVYVSCKGESGPPTMDVGCVKQFGLQHGQQAVRVQWLYTPGIDIPMQDYYGEKELFQSKHHDIVPDRSLNGKCDVKYDVADYNDVLRGTPAEDDTWYTRYRCTFFKDAERGVSARVIPTNVSKICIQEEMKVGCGRPYNPDRFMLRCSKCEKLFHPQCLEIPVSEYTEHNPTSRRCPRPACSVLGIAGLLQGYIEHDNNAHQHWHSASSIDKPASGPSKILHWVAVMKTLIAAFSPREWNVSRSLRHLG